MLSIKPVIEVRDGIVEEVGQGAHAFEGAASCSPRRRRKQKIEHLAVLHGNAPDLDELLDLLDPIFPRDEIITGVVGPVIGTHAGPRVIGVTLPGRPLRATMQPWS